MDLATTATPRDQMETLETSTAGRVRVFRHGPERASAAAVLVGGIRDDVDGPGGAYVELAERLGDLGVEVLRASLRRAGDLVASVEDVRAAVTWLEVQGAEQILLVGWSFGGAVVISAAVEHPSVVGVATLATQAAGAQPAADLAPRPLLLLHGSDDPVLPVSASRRVLDMASEPAELKVYEGAQHAFEGAEDRVVEDVVAFARPLLGIDAAPS